MSRNQYVGDYRLVESIDERGRFKTTYEYIGKAYGFVEAPGAVRRAKRCLALGCVLGWAGFVAALIPDSAAAHALYALLPLAFSALPLGLATKLSAELATMKPPMEHRHADQLENHGPARSFFVSLLSGIALAGEGINLIRGASMNAGDIAFTLGALAVLVSGILCHRQWKHLKCAPTDFGLN